MTERRIRAFWSLALFVAMGLAWHDHDMFALVFFGFLAVVYQLEGMES